MAGIQRTLFVGADRRVRPGVGFTLRPIRSRDQTPQKPSLGRRSGLPLQFCCEKSGLAQEALRLASWKIKICWVGRKSSTSTSL